MDYPSPAYAPNSDGGTPPSLGGTPSPPPKPVQLANGNGHARPSKRKGFKLDLDDESSSPEPEAGPSSAKRPRGDASVRGTAGAQYQDPTPGSSDISYFPPPDDTTHQQQVHPQMVDMSNEPPHHPIPGLEMKSFFGIEPVDEVAKIIGEWLLDVCVGLQHVEIEVKLGKLLDKQTNRRLAFPGILNESVLQNVDSAFRSELSPIQHKTLNNLLNTEVSYCSGRDPQHPAHPLLPPHHYYPIRYMHLYHTDTLYPGAAVEGGGKARGGKRRVTTDTKTGQVLGVMEKRKVASLNVLCPREEFDWRISVNQELPCDMPAEHLKPELERKKDRLTYTHQFFQIDLTQVKTLDLKSGQKAAVPSVTNELELEILDATHFLTQGWLASQEQPNSWYEELTCLVNTVRLLIKNAAPRIKQ